jgi:hypothetical protein
VEAGSIHHQHAECAVLAGVDRLGAQRGVWRVDAAVEATGRVHLARLVGHHQDDLVAGVEPGIVVVVVPGSGDAVAGEHHRRAQPGVGGEAERLHVGAHVPLPPRHLDRARIADGHPDGDLERLSVTAFAARS